MEIRTFVVDSVLPMLTFLSLWFDYFFCVNWQFLLVIIDSGVFFFCKQKWNMVETDLGTVAIELQLRLHVR